MLLFYKENALFQLGVGHVAIRLEWQSRNRLTVVDCNGRRHDTRQLLERLNNCSGHARLAHAVRSASQCVPILDLARIISLRRSVTRAGSSRTIASFSSIMIP